MENVSLQLGSCWWHSSANAVFIKTDTDWLTCEMALAHRIEDISSATCKKHSLWVKDDF